MEVDANEKEGSSICVKVTDKSAVVNVSTDVSNGGEGCGDIRGVVHC